MKIHIYKAVNGQFYFNIIAKNGQIIATSETYISKRDCKDTANLIKADAYNAKIVDKTRAIPVQA